eukprot:tig00001264_g7878.t1
MLLSRELRDVSLEDLMREPGVEIHREPALDHAPCDGRVRLERPRDAEGRDLYDSMMPDWFKQRFVPAEVGEAGAAGRVPAAGAGAQLCLNVSNPAYVAVLPGGFFQYDDGFADCAGRRVVYEDCGCCGEAGGSFSEYRYFDKLFVLVQRYSGAYYHWLAQALPRLLVAERVLRGDPGVRILVDGLPFQLESLALLGFPRERLVAARPGGLYGARRLYFASPASCYAPLPARTAALRRALLAAAGPAPRPAPAEPPPIVVTRRSAGARVLVNHGELMGALRAAFPRERFVEFEAGGEDFAAQLALFRSARAVLGPHGAGNTNAALAPLHAPFIEFLPAREPIPSHYSLLAGLGRGTWRWGGGAGRLSAGMAVDVAAVVRALRAALEPRPEHQHAAPDPGPRPRRPPRPALPVAPPPAPGHPLDPHRRLD